MWFTIIINYSTTRDKTSVAIDDRQLVVDGNRFQFEKT